MGDELEVKKIKRLNRVLRAIREVGRLFVSENDVDRLNKNEYILCEKYSKME